MPCSGLRKQACYGLQRAFVQFACHVDGQAMAVEGAQIQSYPQGTDLDVAAALIRSHDFSEVLVQVELVVALVRCCIHGAAVRNHQKNASLRWQLLQALAGPLHGLSINTLPEKIGASKGRNPVTAAPPGLRSRFEDEVQCFVQAAGKLGPASALPVFSCPAAIPGSG